MAGMSRIRGGVSPKVIGGIVVLVILGAVVYVLNSPSGSSIPEPQAYYIDLNSGERFTANANLGPAPITLPERGEAVAAVMFGCGSCDAPFVGYVEKATPEYKSQAAELEEQAYGDAPLPVREEAQRIIDQGVLVAAWPEDAGANPSLTWVVRTSAEGKAIVDSVNEVCKGKRTRPCSPEISSAK